MDQNVALDALTLELTLQVTLEGSNRRRHELCTQTHWHDLLQYLEGSAALFIVFYTVKCQKDASKQNTIGMHHCSRFSTTTTLYKFYITVT